MSKPREQSARAGAVQAQGVRHTPPAETSVADDLTEQLILDGHKLPWHMERVEAWDRGERIAPITIDMALTRKCDYACGFCYAMLQENDRGDITQEVMDGFLADSAEMGVRGISLVSDGESLLSPVYVHAIQRGGALGIAMASGTNGRTFTPEKLDAVLPHLSYLRFNFSGGERTRYADIMGTKPEAFDRVVDNVRYAVNYKRGLSLPVTIGLQMVLMPQDIDQVMPLARLGISLGVDYVVIKHCSDDESGSLGVDYGAYGKLTPQLKAAEELSTPDTAIVIKWEKIQRGNVRSYSACYGPPFIIQMSGSGLVAPCGQMFNDKYAKFHIGSIVEERWLDIWKSDRYWEVMDYLHGQNFDPRYMCGVLCLQDRVNEALFNHKNGTAPLRAATGTPPLHREFV